MRLPVDWSDVISIAQGVANSSLLGWDSHQRCKCSVTFVCMDLCVIRMVVRVENGMWRAVLDDLLLSNLNSCSSADGL